MTPASSISRRTYPEKSGYSELAFVPEFVESDAVAPLSRRRRREDAEGKSVNVETTNDTLTKANQPAQADGDRVGALTTDVRRRYQRASFFFSDDEFKINFEKLAQICKIAVGQFRAFAVEGSTLAKTTELDLTIIWTSSVVDPEQIMAVTNTATEKLSKAPWRQNRNAFRVPDLFATTHLKTNTRTSLRSLMTSLMWQI